MQTAYVGLVGESHPAGDVVGPPIHPRIAPEVQLDAVVILDDQVLVGPPAKLREAEPAVEGRGRGQVGAWQDRPGDRIHADSADPPRSAASEASTAAPAIPPAVGRGAGPNRG